MPTTQNLEKRLVPKGKYATYLMGKTSMATVGASLMVVGSGVALLFLLGGLLMIALPNGKSATPILGLICLLIATLPGYIAFVGRKLIQEARNMERLAPITRHSAALLPAVDSLVRPSSAASIPQDRVLLRATVATDETAAEELLRPHG